MTPIFYRKAAKGICVREATMDVNEAVALCDDIAAQFHFRYGGDLDDLKQDAFLAYLEAKQGFDPTRGNFTSRVRFCVLRDLFESVRTRQRNATNCRRRVAVGKACETVARDGTDIYSLPARGAVHGWIDFLADLSEEAVEAVRIIFDTPGEIFQTVGAGKKERATVAARLEELGWEAEKISEVFSEISAAVA